ncbi:MAG TPA: hypothetical protein VMU06_09545 [Stellaceae bacterium]|nr:hypothetical protein [Stellaceae bacterium]
MVKKSSLQASSGLAVAPALALVLLATAAMRQPAVARCTIVPGEPVTATGWIMDAWFDRHGNAIYVLDADPPSCDGEITFVRGPGAVLQCRSGQEAQVVGRYEPVTFDFTGSGYLIRAESLSCR